MLKSKITRSVILLICAIITFVVAGVYNESARTIQHAMEMCVNSLTNSYKFEHVVEKLLEIVKQTIQKYDPTYRFPHSSY